VSAIPRGPSPAVPALVLAARAGDLDGIAALLGSGAEVDGADPAGVTPLMAAAAAGHEQAVRRLLAEGARRERAALDGTTAILAALARGHGAAAKALIPLVGSDPRSLHARVDGHGVARLAAEIGDPELFRVLFDAGAPGGAPEAARLLLRHMEHAGRRVVLCSAGRPATTSMDREMGGGDVPDVFAVDARPPLHVLPADLQQQFASPRAGELVVGDPCDPALRIVLDATAEAAPAGSTPAFVPVGAPALNAIDLHDELCAPRGGKRRRCAIEWATAGAFTRALEALEPRGEELVFALGRSALERRTASVEPLLRLGADPNAADEHGRTPLESAIEGRDPGIVRLLLAAGAHPGPAPGREPPLVLAALGSSDVALRALLDAGASPDAPGEGGRTALHVAAGRCDAETVQLLIGAGASVHALDAEARTPLHLASATPSGCEVVGLLLDAGADPETSDAGGLTPLLLALRCSGHATAGLLLARGARAGAVAADGSTTLHLAVRTGAVGSLIEALVRAGADPKARDAAGATALDLALEGSSLASVPELLRAGTPIDESVRVKAAASGIALPRAQDARGGRAEGARMMLRMCEIDVEVDSAAPVRDLAGIATERGWIAAGERVLVVADRRALDMSMTIAAAGLREGTRVAVVRSTGSRGEPYVPEEGRYAD